MGAPDFSKPQSGESPSLLVAGVAIGDGDFAAVAADHPDAAARSIPSNGLDSWLAIVRDGIVADQVERALVRGLSRASRQQTPLDRKNITRLYGSDAHILTFAEIPLVHMHLIPRPDRPWGSLGDARTVATAAALANAVLDATGKHSRRVVLDPDSVNAII